MKSSDQSAEKSSQNHKQVQKSTQVKLSDLQLMVMKVLWQQGKLSVADTHQLLNQQKEMALTTVATLLKRMAEKNIVGYEKDGRQLLYYPLISEQETKTSMLSSLLSNLFNDNPSELVHHLVSQDEVNQDDLDKIQQLLQQGNAQEGKTNE
ncbi:MAG: BlaI/MecI/CopY family transcriptional regulator [Kangiellaceae bacterium]|nr:BlaI/MecI/CopY family transcriptional regulator [Kangiellaceae bacterium]MCW8998860.1 BlaI/MecI/CopY family transcriptional regulator [Kangiellaceae bacterium]